MKIGILTLPVNKNNYGGMIQAYALKTVLQRMGYDVCLLQRDSRLKHQGIHWSIARVIRNITYWILNIKYVSKEDQKYIVRHTKYFVNKYIPEVSPTFDSSKKLKAFCKRQKFDAYVVGSDQVWRTSYASSLANYFLDFTTDMPVKRLAYAASFGVGHWEFTDEQTKVFRKLAQNFDAISTREDSGVDLCREYLGVEAVHVLDPTLLLDKSEYVELVENECEPNRDGKLFCYFLDKTERVHKLAEDISTLTGYKHYFCMPEWLMTKENILNDIDKCSYPALTTWLKSFLDAKLVLTDSFHGCIFSIIFQKPFWVIANKSRGVARINSLLKMFNLENRLIEDFCNIDVMAEIDWQNIDVQLAQWRKISMSFLITHLQ